MRKKILMLILAVFMLTLTAGCNNSSQNLPVQAPENTKQEINIEYGEITDPVELEKLWQEYFYDTIANVSNTREFNSAVEIDPANVAKFCARKYVNDFGQESLELESADSFNRLFPLDTILEYTERYFDLTSLDVSEIEDSYYNPEKRAFIFRLNGKQDRPGHTERNSWGIHLGKVTRTSDGTITAVLNNYDSYETRRVELTITYTLKPREDGSLYFVSGRWDYVNNHLVSLTGDYQRFDKIKGFAGNMDELSILGENDKQLILAHSPYDKSKNASLMLLDPETMSMEKKLELNANFTSTKAGLTGEKIVVRLKDRIITFDKTLEQLQEISLPGAIKDKIEREPQYDDDGFRHTYFGGYDVSSDLKSIVYADEKGVKLFNLADSHEKLLSSTAPIAGTMLNSYHSNPRFVDNGQKVITTMLGYESIMGYTLCNLKDGTCRNYDISSGGSSSGRIRYDTGLLEITGVYIEENQTTEYNLLYLDFKTGDVKEIKLEECGDSGGLRDYYSYVGQNYAAFTTYHFDNDYAQNMFYLNSLNLQILQMTSKVVSVKAAQINILGVLADGRVVFWYSLNPSENGICITR